MYNIYAWYVWKFIQYTYEYSLLYNTFHYTGFLYTVLAFRALQNVSIWIIRGTNCFDWRLGCFTYFFFHAVLMLASSVSIAVKLVLAVRSKRELTQASSKTGDKSGAGTSGSRREIQAAITVCTVALMQCLAYFPTAATCMAVCLANESPQFAQVSFSFYHLTMSTSISVWSRFVVIFWICRTIRTSTRSSLWATTWAPSPSQLRTCGTFTSICSVYASLPVLNLY